MAVFVAVFACFLIATGDLPGLVSADHTVDSGPPGPPDFCLEGPFHKPVPGPEDESFHECLAWQDLSCCNTNLSKLISDHKAEALYNYSWDLCSETRPLSQGCEVFIKDEECFYQCEPMLGYFQIEDTGYIKDVPVCADYCDAWFQACKDDLTCVENWLEDFHFEVDGSNKCPVGSQCVTFAQMYGSGRGLCNKMWGEAFYYETNKTNCTVMTFNPKNGNPNFGLLLHVESPTSSCVHLIMTAYTQLLLAILALKMF